MLAKEGDSNEETQSFCCLASDGSVFYRKRMQGIYVRGKPAEPGRGRVKERGGSGKDPPLSYGILPKLRITLAILKKLSYTVDCRCRTSQTKGRANAIIKVGLLAINEHLPKRTTKNGACFIFNILRKER